MLKYNPKYQLKHLSVRVPWHDAGWNGKVCNNPKENGACLILKNCALNRDDANEEGNAGKLISDLEEANFPTCVGERGFFMSPFPITRNIKHPYASSSKSTHGHLRETLVRYPEYSFGAIPFNWMSKRDSEERINLLDLDFQIDREPKLDFGPSDWIQEYHNQKAMLDGFFEHVDPLRSLVFIYAKQVPFVEEGGRVLIGAGKINNIYPSKKYETDGNNSFECAYWEHMVTHTIRSDFKNGFILPYHDAIEYQKENSSFDPAELAVIAPSDKRYEFSYASEHVGHDTAIRILLQCLKSWEIAKAKGIGKQHDIAIQWIHDRVHEIEKLRGDYPGMGAALCAFGLSKGHFVAAEIANKMKDGGNPWKLFEQALADYKGILSDAIAELIPQSVKRNYLRLSAKESSERLSLLHLISRFDLTIEQATVLYVKEIREEKQIKITDDEILKNPYLIYEVTRLTESPIELTAIDFGLVNSKKNPGFLPIGVGVDDPMDDRRVRAFTVQELEKATLYGNTLLPRKTLVNILRELPLPEKLLINGDMYELAEEIFSGVIEKVEMKDGSPAYQLSRLSEMAQIIREKISDRKKAARLPISENWKKLLDEELDKHTKGEVNKNEPVAREEKVAALKEMAESRVSVLIGSAGTGKTTLLAILSRQKEIAKGGIVFLAPTGKARVKMQEVAKKNNLDIPAFTLAQFLMNLERYDPNTQRYKLSGAKSSHKYETVILDEASMLTEEMLATLLDSFENVKRFILVGDHRQLPPIGAGRPFVDIIQFLKPNNIEEIFPKVATGYSELTIRMRQNGANRNDIQLAEWFSGNPLAAGEDAIINEILHQKKNDNIRLVKWENESDFEKKFEQILQEELKLTSFNDNGAFNTSLGSEDGKYFNSTQDANYFENEPAVNGIECWQVLSPVREKTFGVKAINRKIHKSFRQNTISYCHKYSTTNFPKPMGVDEIVYGDKIINLSNQHRGGSWKPVRPEGGMDYIANGEIGIVVGQFKRSATAFKGRPKWMEVEFASQKGYVYQFNQREFSEESNTVMELAYCITVHKSQGSEFDTVFLVIPNPCFLLTREMLYTALTRQKDRVVVLYQGDFANIKELTSPRFSDTIRRITNLFEKPQMVESKKYPGVFLEKNLIQEATDGTFLRSKSELNIYQLLLEAKLNPIYERELNINDVVKYPDFTIENDDKGITYYWEHCGMMHDREYVQRWQEKLAWYQENEILPWQVGGGKRGTLIVTEDRSKIIDGETRGAISLKEISALIQQLFFSN